MYSFLLIFTNFFLYLILKFYNNFANIKPGLVYFKLLLLLYIKTTCISRLLLTQRCFIYLSRTYSFCASPEWLKNSDIGSLGHWWRGARYTDCVYCFFVFTHMKFSFVFTLRVVQMRKKSAIENKNSVSLKTINFLFSCVLFYTVLRTQ
jgi:hypothetical protein